jgi:hypothetical protein
MTLAKARAKASAKAKHIHNTGINYDRHLQSLKYFYSTGHSTSLLKSITKFTVKISFGICILGSQHYSGALPGVPLVKTPIVITNIRLG